MGEPRVIVVGAGPAGVRAAEALVAAGVRPIVIDENPRDGGQIYRRQPQGFMRPYEVLYGTEAQRAAALHAAFDMLRARIDYRSETLVWNIAGAAVYTACQSRQETLSFDALILSTGATDRVLPIPGWHLAGCYTLGGAQVALKAQACAIGHRVVFVGTGPLLYLVASQYLKAGAEVAAVLDTSPWRLRVRALPRLLAAPGVLANGLRLALALRSAGVRVANAIEPLAIEGEPERGIEAIVFRDARGNTVRIACDAVAMGYHLRPETQLADLARCELRFEPRTRQWLPRVDDEGRSSVRGIYLAGDGARVLGARAAERSGELAALAALSDLGRSVSHARRAGLQKELAKWSRFAAGLAEAFPWPAGLAQRLPDAAVVCRCEVVTAGELRGVVRTHGAQEANRAKAFSRVGMGRCQGRYCGSALAEIVAAACGTALEQTGRLRGQAPVKPLPIALEESAS